MDSTSFTLYRQNSGLYNMWFKHCKQSSKPCHKSWVYAPTYDPQGWSNSIQLSQAPFHLKHESRVISKSILTFANISNRKKIHGLFITDTDNLKKHTSEMQYKMYYEYIASNIRRGVKIGWNILLPILWKMAVEDRHKKCGENSSCTTWGLIRQKFKNENRSRAVHHSTNCSKQVYFCIWIWSFNFPFTERY